MANYRLTKEADADIAALYEYGIIDFGLEQAQSYVLGLYERFEVLAETPNLGRSAAEISSSLRRLNYRSNVIFYCHSDDGILIVRILRAEMDFERHL